MRVAISGHGHDQGKFPDRPNYRTKNAAEFDMNTYEIKLNDEAEGVVGNIFYSNADNYPQAGTYQYDRANWGPGNPLYTHYWEIQNLPESGGELTLDFDLERFNSAMKEPNAEGSPNTSSRWICSAMIAKPARKALFRQSSGKSSNGTIA